MHYSMMPNLASIYDIYAYANIRFYFCLYGFYMQHALSIDTCSLPLLQGLHKASAP